jgi:hypothetical protein
LCVEQRETVCWSGYDRLCYLQQTCFITLKHKYKMERRVVEPKRKRHKQAEDDVKNGVVKVDSKNVTLDFPTRGPLSKICSKIFSALVNERKKLKQKPKLSEKEDLRSIKYHMEAGGSARTIEELMAKAKEDQQTFDKK